MSIPSWAVRGAKVVCINAGSHDGRIWMPGEAPVKGATYTIRSVFIDVVGAVAVLLEEIDRAPGVADHFGGPVGYHVSRFRPVITEEDDLATHFEQYLKTDHRATRRVGEDA